MPRSAWLFLAAAALVSFVAAGLAPLHTYALTLAAFGLVHVLTELRYVDRRFAGRIPFRTTASWLAVIAAIVLLRVARMSLELEAGVAGALELGLVGLLALLVLPVLRRAGWWKGGLVLLTVALLLLGAWHAPVATLVILAVGHNFTPIAFLYERLPAARGRLLAGLALLFGVIPLAIALGYAETLLHGVTGHGMATDGPLGTGTLENHLGAFVPAAAQDGRFAYHAFAAAAYLQCMHYAVVIGILPRLEPAPDDARAKRTAYVRWPGRAAWLVLLGVVSIGGFLVYAWSFDDARTFYGLFALVHAWIEVPVLLAALAPLPESA